MRSILVMWGSMYTLIGMFVSAKEFAEQQKYGGHPDITEAVIGCVFWPAIVVFWAVKWLSIYF